MKKLFLLSAAALMVLASCTKDEVAQTPDQKITFSSPVVKPSTKVIVDDIYPTTENFNVSAIYTTSNFTSWASGQAYMTEVECEYISADNAWESKTEYYWPKNDSYLTFAAYSPSSLANVAELGANGLVINDYVVDANTDVLYSDRTIDKQSNSGTNSDYSKDAVDIDFHHALSLIKFTAKTDKQYNNLNFVLNSVKISNNIVNKGSFQQGLKDDASNTYQSTEYPKWTNSIVATDVTGYVVEKSCTLKATAQDYNNNAVNTVTTGGFIVLPQTISENATITITYTVTDDRNKIPVLTEKTFDLNTFFAEWEMGFKYTYNIIIGADVIRFNPDVVAWETTSASADIKI